MLLIRIVLDRDARSDSVSPGPGSGGNKAPMRRSWLLLCAALASTWTLPAFGQPGEPAPEPGEPSEQTDESAALEEEPERPRTVTPELEDDGPEQPLTPLAVDTLGGHVMISASVLWAIPFARLEADVDQADWMSAGPGFGIELAYGVSRNVALGVWGQLLMLGDGVDCRDCSTQSLAAGGFVRYHLVQGQRFDPWMSAGIGFRTTAIEQVDGDDRSYSGIEWLRLAVGGDWYAFDNLGFGPYLELDMGRYTSRSPALSDGSANHWHFVTGARITFDAPGK
jgi:hypothetical protein